MLSTVAWRKKGRRWLRKGQRGNARYRRFPKKRILLFSWGRFRTNRLCSVELEEHYRIFRTVQCHDSSCVERKGFWPPVNLYERNRSTWICALVCLERLSSSKRLVYSSKLKDSRTETFLEERTPFKRRTRRFSRGSSFPACVCQRYECVHLST